MISFLNRAICCFLPVSGTCNRILSFVMGMILGEIQMSRHFLIKAVHVLVIELGEFPVHTSIGSATSIKESSLVKWFDHIMLMSVVRISQFNFHTHYINNVNLPTWLFNIRSSSISVLIICPHLLLLIPFSFCYFKCWKLNLSGFKRILIWYQINNRWNAINSNPTKRIYGLRLIRWMCYFEKRRCLRTND